jgi:uracil-DNA glycosylase family 4
MPPRDCPLCPRLVEYRATNRTANPDWFNAPVPSFGPVEAPLLIVGLAPGLRGANRTGRPFTGDFAGLLLYDTLLRLRLAEGCYGANPSDGLKLTGCRITNAVRCVPPANLPAPAEVTTCNRFLKEELRGMPRLRAILALGAVAHRAVLRVYGIPTARLPFRHGSINELPPGVPLGDSYHVSRLNTNTGKLTPEMFESVLRELLASAEGSRAR